MLKQLFLVPLLAAAVALSGCAQLGAFVDTLEAKGEAVLAKVPEYCQKRDKSILRKMALAAIELAATEPVANIYDEAVWKVCEWNGVNRPASGPQQAAAE